MIAVLSVGAPASAGVHPCVFGGLLEVQANARPDTVDKLDTSTSEFSHNLLETGALWFCLASLKPHDRAFGDVGCLGELYLGDA